MSRESDGRDRSPIRHPNRNRSRDARHPGSPRERQDQSIRRERREYRYEREQRFRITMQTPPRQSLLDPDGGGRYSEHQGSLRNPQSRPYVGSSDDRRRRGTAPPTAQTSRHRDPSNSGDRLSRRTSTITRPSQAAAASGTSSSRHGPTADPTPSTSGEGTHISRRGCQFCAKITLAGIYIVLEHDLRHYLKDKTKNREKLSEFFRAINALMNTKGGGVVIHAENPESLGLFDQKIDNKLSQLIPDDALFHNIYERHYHEDQNHIVYRVKARDPNRPLSTLEFNSKMSRNSGRADLTHSQMKLLLSLPQPQRGSQGEVEKLPDFVLDQKVEVQRGSFREPFQEGASVQAKAPPDFNKLSGFDNAEKLTTYCWENIKIQEYISAFTKVSGGGSVYIGVKEQGTEIKEWVEVTVADDILTVQNNEYKVWKNENAEEDECVYHVAKEEKVRTKKQVKSGAFECQGLRLTEGEQTDFVCKMSQRMSNEMLWLGPSAPDPIYVDFIPVTNAPDKCVVRFQIPFFDGICFHDKDGPESYLVCGHAKPDIQKQRLEHWLKRNGGSDRLKEQNQTFSVRKNEALST